MLHAIRSCLEMVLSIRAVTDVRHQAPVIEDAAELERLSGRLATDVCYFSTTPAALSS